MYVDHIRAYVPRNDQEAAEKAAMLEYILPDPEKALTRENRQAHVTCSGLVLNRQGTRVLMAHHDLYKVWAWTGGHADGDGDLLSVAMREAREETGVVHLQPLSPEIASLEILPVWAHRKRGQYVPGHLHLNVSYLLLADENDPLTARAGENSGVAWLPVEGLGKITGEWQMDPIYEKLLARARELL